MKIVKDVKIMKKGFVFFFMSFIAFMFFMPAFPIAQDAVVGWLRDRAIPLQTVEAGRGFADLQPLKKIIGDARIVALGEATHGTREFFQLKHRMLEFLATEMGFTIFSIEANMPEAYRLNDYVLTGVGDPAALLRGMYFWTWDTEEVLDMIRWMRRFNETGKGKLEFTGFDMQTADRRRRNRAGPSSARATPRTRPRSLTRPSSRAGLPWAAAKHSASRRARSRSPSRPGNASGSAATSGPRTSRAVTRGCGGVWTARTARSRSTTWRSEA